MKIVISQPRYLPAINYIQRLYFADLFVFHDNCQRQPHGWENRNKIIMDGKVRWVTMPIASSRIELIINTRINSRDWIIKHKRILHNAYNKHPHYDGGVIDAYYSGISENLEKFDYDYTEAVIHFNLNICKLVGFTPMITRASYYSVTDGLKGPYKLYKICQEVGAKTYISGANGREYGVMEPFAGSKIKVLFHDYEYPVYEQYGQKDFIPWLSFFDPIFNVGLEKVKQWIYEKPKLSN